MDRYHYTECGLDYVWLLNGFETVETGYGPAVHVENVEGLHRMIGEHVVGLDRPLAGPEVRFLRESMELSQRELGELLGLRDGQQIMKVENGRRALRAAADQSLRAMYLEHEHSDFRLEVRRLLVALRDARAHGARESKVPTPLELEAGEHAWRMLARVGGGANAR